MLPRHGIPLPSPAELEDLTLAWHRLDPWPDAVPGLTALRGRYTIGSLSNGNTGLLHDLAAHGGLPWHAVLGAETARAYKPTPPAYLRNVALLGLEPGQVMLAAAHNGDLGAAAALGLRTAFVHRPAEHGPAQTTDLAPDGPWDLVARDIADLAELLGCTPVAAPGEGPG